MNQRTHCHFNFLICCFCILFCFFRVPYSVCVCLCECKRVCWMYVRVCHVWECVLCVCVFINKLKNATDRRSVHYGWQIFHLFSFWHRGKKGKWGATAKYFRDRGWKQTRGKKPKSTVVLECSIFKFEFRTVCKWVSGSLTRPCWKLVLIPFWGLKIISRVGKWVSTLLKTSFSHLYVSSMAGVLYFLYVMHFFFNNYWISLFRDSFSWLDKIRAQTTSWRVSNKVHSLSAQQATISCHLFFLSKDKI